MQQQPRRQLQRASEALALARANETHETRVEERGRTEVLFLPVKAGEEDPERAACALELIRVCLSGRNPGGVNSLGTVFFIEYPAHN